MNWLKRAMSASLPAWADAASASGCVAGEAHGHRVRQRRDDGETEVSDAHSDERERRAVREDGECQARAPDDAHRRDERRGAEPRRQPVAAAAAEQRAHEVRQGGDGDGDERGR